jgi:lipoprotein NlpI
LELHRVALRSIRTLGCGMLLGILALPCPHPAVAQSDQSFAACNNNDEAFSDDVVIKGCTALIQSGALTQHHLVIALVNRGLAYYGKGDDDRAIADYNEAIRLRPNFAVAFNNRGWLYFDKGNYANASRDFARGVESSPTNSYVAIYAYLARARSGGEGTADLESSAVRLNHSDWPYPVVEFLLGRRTSEAMLASAKTANNRCEAQFYLGEWYLLRRDNAAALPALREAASTCPKSFDEYIGAKAELRRLGAS